jgi:hypothetical protein
MSELPEDWHKIKADKVFWDMVQEFREKDSMWSLLSKEELQDDDNLHGMARDFVRSEGTPVFSVDFINGYGEPDSASVKEVAGKYYVTGWVEDTLCGPHATIEEAARFIISCGNGDTFMGASSSLPDERMHELCEEAAGSNNQFEINGVMHVMTKGGLVPGTAQSLASSMQEWHGAINAPGLLTLLESHGRECGIIKPGEGLPETEEALKAMVAAAIKSGKTEFVLGELNTESACSEVKVFAGYYWGCTRSGIIGPYLGLEEAVEQILSLAEIHNYKAAANGSVSDAFLAERCARFVEIYDSFEINGKVYVKTESGLELEGS